MDAASTQVRFAKMLLGRAGYSTAALDASYAHLGASDWQDHGSVDAWLASLDREAVARLCDELLAVVKRQEQASDPLVGSVVDVRGDVPSSLRR